METSTRVRVYADDQLPPKQPLSLDDITFEATIDTRERDNEIVVVTKVHGLAQYNVAEAMRKTTGYVVGPVNPRTRALAERMVKAINAKAVFYDPYIGVNIYGENYFHAHSRVLGRMMNADLKRLGF